ncbi:MAG: urea carboxylase-associated protein 2 [Caulobacteraceae bacterium]|nr:urea carboxylase-associated protein 2 [Caulobacteraceae bacterium]
MSTADPHGAQAHARAQAGTRVEAMPTLPAAEASDRPAGVEPDQMLWAETIAPGGYASRRLNRGARLKLTDLAGEACVSLLIFNAELPTERLNVADTSKVQWNAYLGQGGLLLSDMGRVLASILEDTTGGAFDLFCGASNQASNARKYGDGFNYGAHPNARDRFLIALAKHGLGRRDVHPCLNLFKPIQIAPDGAVRVEVGPFAPGRSITFRAEMDLIVVLANCPHVLDPRAGWTLGPVRASAWRGEPAPADDPIRRATPEGLRAFLNSEDFFLR